MTVYTDHIGTDESGKGDYFGPLVVAGVFLKKKACEELLAAGAKDSKRLTDNRNRELAEQIKSSCSHSIIAIGPEKYNALYAKMKNLNLLMAWAHAKAIENLIEKEAADYVVSDKFGSKDYVTAAMLKTGKTIKIIEEHHAESDPAVACASILARAEFVRRLGELSIKYKFELPKGASEKVVDAAKRFKAEHGRERLGEVAKLHWKITKKL